MEQINIKPVEKKKPKVVAKISKVSSILDTSDRLRRNSLKLRKTFENGTYQKRTQLSVLKRYKRRLDAIELENERVSRIKSRKKINLPSIKKFAGNFFAPGASDDPLKAIGALAAFNAATKASGGDLLGALGPALVAGGSILGPALVGGAVGGMMNMGRKSPKGFDKFGKKVSSKSQERYFQRYGEKAFKNRFGKDNLKNIQNVTEGPKIGKAFGRFGKAIIPGVGAAVGAIDATLRAQEGDVTGSTIAGTSASLDALAAASAATGIGLPVAGLLSIASFGLDVVNLVRDLSGASEKEIETNKPKKDRLKAETEKQKKLVEKGNQANKKLTFGKTLNSYDRALTKFENFSKGFSTGMGMSQTQIKQTASRIEDLGGGSTPISEPGYEFTQQESFSQYLTGDPNSPSYDPSHGGSNYHEHLAFKNAETARRAYEFLQSKGITVTELNVKSGHSPNSAHYQGRAFDVPGSQVPVGQEPQLSAKVRAFMNDFYNLQTSRRKKSSNIFNLEIHSVSPNERKRSGLIASYIDPETGMSKSLSSTFGSYARNFRGGDLGGPKRGLNLIETDMKRGVEFNAKKLFEVIKANPNQEVNLFAGHNDITKGETGTAGEQKYTREVAERVMQLARAAKLKNVKYYPSIIANDPNDPNANWNRAATLRGPSTVQLTPRSSRSRFIQQYPSYDPRSQMRQIITVPIPTPSQKQKVVQGESSKVMIIPGPSEEEVLNSFYKRVLLNTLQ